MKKELYEDLRNTITNSLQEPFDNQDSDAELDYETLCEYVDYADYPYINPESYPDIMSFWKAVDSEFELWKQNLTDYIGISESELDAAIENIEECSDYFDSSEWLFRMYINYYVDSAMDAFPEAFDYQSQKNHCCVCNKPIEYCSSDSVMLTDHNWMKVLKYYTIVDYEKEAQQRAMELYRYYDMHGMMKMNLPDNCYTYICNDCMEKALGHKLTPEDLNGSPFNDEYCIEHFGRPYRNK